MRSDYQTRYDLLLLGHPPVSDFFHVVRTMVRGGEQEDAAELARQWRAANAHVRSLEQEEAGLIEHPTLQPLPSELVELTEASLQDSAVRQTNSISPRRWALVELDRLVVFQKRIDLAWAAQLEEGIEAPPSHRDVIRLALGQSLRTPAVRLVRSDDSTYTLSCKSGELRFFGTKLLDPSCAASERLTGELTHVIGLFIGFGLSLMSAVHFRNRLILTNGSHRAFALRSKGVTHAPFWVAEAGDDNELELLGLQEVRAQLERCARARRPPLFKDYFDPRLRKIVPVVRTSHTLQLQVSCRTLRVPAGG